MGYWLLHHDHVVANDGVGSLIVQAIDADEAKDVAKRHSGAAAHVWENSTAVEIISTLDWEGFTFRIRLLDPDSVEVVDVSFTSTSADDTIDEIGAQLVILLNATTPIAGAAYATQVLKVAETTDALGDHTLEVTITNPAGNPVDHYSSVVHEGAEADAVTVTLGLDATIAPSVLHKLGPKVA
jgi:hypothetical protein